MTIRPATLERLGTDLLVDRLRKAPDDDQARAELSRRGLPHLIQHAVTAEAEDRMLEEMSHEALTARAYALDREVSDVHPGGVA